MAVNPQPFWISGVGPEDRQLEGDIRRIIADPSSLTRFSPTWAMTGFPDFACTLHSAGIAFWVAFGHEAGFDTIPEMPAPPYGLYQQVALDIRSDVVWLDKQTGHAEALIEFERYSGGTDQQKLLEKAGNLLIAHHRWERHPALLVLAYWTKGLLNLPSHQLLQARVRSGFEVEGHIYIAGDSTVKLLTVQFVVEEIPDGRWRLAKIIQRGDA